MRKLFCFAILAFLLFTVRPEPVEGHPGRLDKNGCHEVTEDWQYESGKVLKAGTEHCHRGLGAMQLDGKEMLQDHADPGKSVREIKSQARREACLKASLDVLRDVERTMIMARAGEMILTKDFVAVGKRAGNIIKECEAKK